MDGYLVDRTAVEATAEALRSGGTALEGTTDPPRNPCAPSQSVFTRRRQIELSHRYTPEPTGARPDPVLCWPDLVG